MNRLRWLPLLILGLTQPAAAEILCRRDPTIYNVGSVEGNREDNPCNVSYKLQGITYVCTKIEKFSDIQRKHFPALVKAAKERCEEICHSQHPSCHGTFLAPPDCAGYIEKGSALAYGKEAACGSHCEGMAMSYCSIYKAAPLRTDDKSIFVKFAPNCFCKP